MKRFLISLLSFLTGLALSYIIFHQVGEENPPPEVVILKDTVPIITPSPVQENLKEEMTAVLPLATSSKSMDSKKRDSTAMLVSMPYNVEVPCDHPPDSVEVVIPITQKVYEDSTYLAYVSGYNPSLDSIFVFRQREYITEYVTKTKNVQSRPKRFSIGFQAGYGYTPNGFQPYVGLGMSVSLFSF